VDDASIVSGAPSNVTAVDSAGIPERRIQVEYSPGLQVGDGNLQVNVYGGTAPRPKRGWVQYRENILDIAPSGGLLDRVAELAELSDFCSSGDSYLWWQGGPWAGKSALLSWFALNPPPGIVPVCFFITARYASQSDSSAFLASMLAQLEELCTPCEWETSTDTQAAAAFSALLREAAQSARAQGRRVVLVVDGLDEDRGPGMGMRSIASLLPRRYDDSLKVIVASRPHPPIPRDVPPDHPLRSGAIKRELPSSLHARVIRDSAEMELQALMSGSRAQQDIVGFLSAASGGLSAADLAELTGQIPFEIHTTLRGVSGRTFTERTSPWAEPGTAERVYLLAHETLQEEAAKGIGPGRLQSYYRRLGEWAARYRSQGWPTDTPAYLLDGYFRNARRAGDRDRLTSCATDGLRHDRMLARSGADEAAIAEVDVTKSVILAEDDPDLTAMLRLSLHGEELEARTALLPVELPAVWAIMGQLPRAEALARSLGAPDLQGRALGQVVSELVTAGEQGQAVRLAASIADIARAVHDPEQKLRLLAEAARAFAACGNRDKAAGHAAAAAAAAANINTEPWKAAALADVTAAMVAAGQSIEARRTALKAAAAAAAVNWQSRGWETLAAVVSALAAADLEQDAVDLTQLAPPAWKGSIFAAAAAAVGPRDRALARRLVSQAEKAGCSSAALADVSGALAAVGDFEQARVMARKSLQQAQAIDDAPAFDLAMTKVTAALCVARLVDEALLAASSIDTQELRSRALASAAVHLARSGDAHRAGDIAMRAQTTAGEDPSEALMQRTAWFASALARTGHAALAARVLEAEETLAIGAGESVAAQEMLESIAETRAALGDYEGAERAARALTRPAALAAVLAALADVSANSRRFPAALLLADEALSQLEAADAGPHWPRRDGTLSRTALAFGKSGQLDRAREIYLRISSLDWRAWVTLEMSRSISSVRELSLIRGWMSEIENFAATTQDHYARDWALACVAEGKAVTGDYGDATRLAFRIADPAPRSQALAGVAAEIHRHGERAESLHLIHEAEAAAREIEDTEELVFALTSVARALTLMGDIACARRVIAKALASGPSHDALSALAALDPKAVATVACDVLATLVPTHRSHAS